MSMKPGLRRSPATAGEDLAAVAVASAVAAVAAVRVVAEAAASAVAAVEAVKAATAVVGVAVAAVVAVGIDNHHCWKRFSQSTGPALVGKSFPVLRVCS